MHYTIAAQTFASLTAGLPVAAIKSLGVHKTAGALCTQTAREGLTKSKIESCKLMSKSESNKVL